MKTTSETMERSVEIRVDSITLPGDLSIPSGAGSLVLFAHGSGSSRRSPRNRFVASVLQKNSIATLLFDLLTPREDTNYEMRFDIEFLTQRLEAVTAWIESQPDISSFSIGYFGASTGAAAALGAAADLPNRIKAVVSRGGRPDITARDLGRVKAATLLIVGGLDTMVIHLNREAFLAIKGAEKQLHVVSGATHLFEEPGTLEEVAQVASKWFKLHLGSPAVS
ncbi:MAG TPA: dienelactone hydrolase family protein [Thermodesulfobacteriota bacterium]|nr:dienelactone hydrolase family protein [Thermodesulfobacteriota bacterium]